jgi:hypothetical protein
MQNRPTHLRAPYFFISRENIALFWPPYLMASVPAEQEAIATEAESVDLGLDGAADAVPQLIRTRAVDRHRHDRLWDNPETFDSSRILYGSPEISGHECGFDLRP